ncbi:MAG: type VI secretion system ImpA family N-terminal domain-containing protein [Burkholderiaceae bacterium]|nr:type VI secretion system ImpA family N-terminal domain-containing protein [Burkholderiaceae bacterium]
MNPSAPASASALAAPPWPTFADPAAPCGPSLEYDNDFLVLQALLQPAPDVQYGHFTGRREGPDWPDVERQCRALLQRSCDINLLVWLTRCRARQAGAQGLHEGLHTLTSALRRFGDHIHPQPDAGDASVRANAIAALADPEGLLGDVRDLTVGANAMGRLAVRDVERALQQPRPAGASVPNAVLAHIEELRRAGGLELGALESAAVQLDELQAWCRAGLGEDAPDLSAMARLLAPFGAPEVARPHSAAVATPTPTAKPAPVAPLPPASGVAAAYDGAAATDPGAGGTSGVDPAPTGALGPVDQHDAALGREQALAAIVSVRRWFEQHEPSSPVGLMLLQAERLVGRPYADVADALPPELIARWSGQQ